MCGNCKDCIYWGDMLHYERCEGLGVCTKAKILSDCANHKHNEDYEYYYEVKESYADQKLFAQDGERGYRADVITRFDYGCVEFEEK